MAKSLKTLFVDGNRLQGTIPNEWTAWEQLEVFGLWSNRLSGALPSWLVNVTTLTWIGLQDNGLLNGTIPTDLWQLTNLTGFGNYNNQFTGPIPTVGMANMTAMESLSLAGNVLTSTIPSELALMTNLKMLNLQRNEFVGQVPTELATLENLRTSTCFFVCLFVACMRMMEQVLWRLS